MPVSVERIRQDIEAIARCTATPGAGATRPTFSPAWAAARAYVIAQAEAAGCDITTDPAGNLRARPGTLGFSSLAWLVGSHLDTVPHGGDYDGVAGVVVALELLRSARDDGVQQLPVELIVFAEEEGPTFGLGMLGSRAWAGDVKPEHLGRLRNAAGKTYLEAGKAFGVEADRIGENPFAFGRYLGFVEVHIEQGPGMWRRDERLAVVRAIAGRRQYRVVVTGEANHAGATAMSDRRDALAAAAQVIVELRRMARELSDECVVTVGRIECRPNAVNVIPSRVEFTIDFRAPTEDLLNSGEADIRAVIEQTAKSHSVAAEEVVTESIAARPMDPRLGERLVACTKATGAAEIPVVVSGALHDSAVIAPHVPTAMLFIPSRDGISHNPAEFSRVEDVAGAARVVERLVRRPTVRQLNEKTEDAFVATCGRAFENSPWIARRAWARRPFASLADLHEKMCAAVRGASADEQVGLIRAHPDLVGRLAREGRMTRESVSEQAAAGLDALTADEVAAFERYNAAYRERFGFPFVVCARENRKAAILEAFPRRLGNSREQEVETALGGVFKIARLRLADAVWED